MTGGRLKTRLLDPRHAGSPVLWFAAVGAPLAWAVQFAFAYWLAEAQCSPSGGDPAGTFTATSLVPISLIAGACACIAAMLSLRMLRATSSNEVDDHPPEGRMRFLAIIGLTAFPLFMAMIVLTGAGVLIHDSCVQS